jgi:hypothetical protein
MRTASLLAFLLLPSLAWAEPITVWLQDTAPEEKQVTRADKETGGTLHLWALDLAFPPEPETAADGAQLEAVAGAVEAGKTRWDQFEVEVPIAKAIDDETKKLTLLRSKRDREDLVRALMFEGASIARATSATSFATDAGVAPFRATYGAVSVPRAWLDAYALMTTTPQRGDLFDGTAWSDWQRFASALSGLEGGSITTDAGVGDVYLDGELVQPGKHDVRPGRHYVHVVRAGGVAGRAVVDVEPGKAYDMPRRVSAAHLAATVAAVQAGKRSDLPASVTSALEELIRIHDGAAYLAVSVGNDLSVLPIDAKLILNDDKLFTALVTADLGGGIAMSKGFDQNEDGSAQIAPAASGGIGFELGVSYFAIGLGLDGVITPGRTLPFADDKSGDNNSVSSFLHPWLGLGAYALRPTKANPTLAILAGVSYLMPDNLGVGGRIAVGVPIDDGHNWVRVLLGGSYGVAQLRDGAEPMLDAYLRVGFAGRIDQ